MTLDEALEEMPIVAILRGIRSAEILTVSEALWSAGIRVIEVPLNSPDPFESIRALVDHYGDRLICGGGTVLDADAVDKVAAAGGRVVVSPDTDTAVIRRTLQQGLSSMPGFGSATEAFAAYKAGARILKLFPASTYGTAHIKALRAVLPGDAAIYPVGGVSATALADWWQAGARGFGIGSDIYKAGQSADAVFHQAAGFVAAMRPLIQH